MAFKITLWSAVALLGVWCLQATAQSFLTAISQYPELSNFTTLMYDNPGLAGALLTSNATSLTKMTVLVPNNVAFTKLETALGVPFGSMTVEELEPILQYHLLVDELTTTDFNVTNGITRPTLLNGPLYNNRSAGAALGSEGAEGDALNGQVVFIQATNQQTTAARLKSRQLQQPGAFSVQGGLGHKINMTAVDGRWDGGVFQIVDHFLDLPLNCTKSIELWKVNSFGSALTRTGLGAPLDVTQNVTCFTPNDAAFLNAGNPQTTDSIFDLQQLTLLHLVDEPLYTNFLEDGQEYTSFSNQTIRITLRDGHLYANEARLIHTNVITNNGLMHVVDRVMSPLQDSQTATTSSAGSPTTTSASTSSSAATATTSTAAAPLQASWGETSWWLGFAVLVFGFWV